MGSGKNGQQQGMNEMILGELQLILAEKRTALSALRTGLGVCALPLSVLSLLVATSRYYRPEAVLHFLVPLLGLCAVLMVLGVYLIFQALRRIRHFDRLVREIKRQHSILAQLVE